MNANSHGNRYPMHQTMIRGVNFEVNMSVARRLMTLLDRIDAMGEVSTKNCNTGFDVSHRQTYRDLKLLEEKGLIKSEMKQEGGCRRLWRIKK